MKICGIYCIKNTVTQKYYFGSSSDMTKRFNKHLNRLRNGGHENSKLQASWNKHGEDNFQFSRILICSREMLLIYEQAFIDYYNASKNGYNICPSAKGVYHSQETRAKLSAINTGKRYSQEINSKKGNPRGTKLPKEWVDNISKAQKGRKQTEKQKLALLEANIGRPLSEEHRAKISAFHKGRKKSEQERINIANALRGRKVSEEQKIKISNTLLGSVIPADVRKKISMALKGKKKPPRTKEHSENISRGKILAFAQKQAMTQGLGGMSAQ